MYKHGSLIILTLILLGCCGTNTEITYTYNGVRILRTDQCGETSFYYQKIGQKINNGRIVAKYSGINDGFKGYLKFNQNGSVEILSGDGYFKSENVKSQNLSYKRIYAADDLQIGGHIYYIDLSSKYEIEENANHKSDIKTKYNIDTIDWW